MILYILLSILSVVSPFLFAGFGVEWTQKLFPREKFIYVNRILTRILVVLSLGLPGWIMSVGGFLRFSTSCWIFLIGMTLYGIAIFGNSGTCAEAFLTTAMIVSLVVMLLPAVLRAKEAQDRKRDTSALQPCVRKSDDNRVRGCSLNAEHVDFQFEAPNISLLRKLIHLVMDFLVCRCNRTCTRCEALYNCLNLTTHSRDNAATSTG